MTFTRLTPLSLSEARARRDDALRVREAARQKALRFLGSAGRGRGAVMSAAAISATVAGSPPPRPPGDRSVHQSTQAGSATMGPSATIKRG